MSKGYILAVTTALILVVMILYVQNFSVKQTTDLDRIAQILVSEKVLHTWSDVNDDIYRTTNLLIEKENNTAIFYDSLPSVQDISNLLHLYGLFVKNYYETPDTAINFISPTGQAMDLGSIPSTITILPFNIQYYYPSWAKRELFISAPEQNVSAIIQVRLLVNLSNAYIDCRPVNPSASSACDFVNPYSECKPSTDHRLYFNLSFSDYLGNYFNLPENCFDLDKHSTENLNVKNSSGNYFIKVLIGSLPTVIDIQLQNTYIAAATSIILNTTDFYINYLSQLRVSAVDYNTSRTDWA